MGFKTAFLAAAERGLARPLIAGLRARRTVTRDRPPIALGLVTSWRTHCGVAAYSEMLANALPRAAVRVSAVPVSSDTGLAAALAAGLSASRLDIVHVQLEYGLFPNVRLGRFRLPIGLPLLYLGLLIGRSKIVTTFHELYEPKSNVSSAYLNFVNKLVCSVSDLIIVHTDLARDSLSDATKAKNKTLVIPHGVLSDPTLMNRDACKSSLGVAGKRTVTLFGFVRPQKGYDLMFDVLPQLADDAVLIVAGGPQVPSRDAYYKHLQARASNPDYAKRVRFLGYVPDARIPIVMNATDVAVLPYERVTQSGVLALLTAYEVPTLTSDIPPFAEHAKRFGSIIMFEAGDRTQLLAQLEKLIRGRKLRARLRLACAKARAAWNWNQVAQKHLAAYLSVLSNPSDAGYD